MILIDTGPIVAMIDRTDGHYERAASFTLRTDRTFLTTEACLTEATYLLRNIPIGADAERIVTKLAQRYRSPRTEVRG